MAAGDNERRWRGCAAAAARRINAARWAEGFRLPAAAGLLVLAVLLLLWRSRAAADPAWSAPALAAALWLLAAAALAWFRCRGRLAGETEGLVRLDERLGLHNRLSAAAEGAVSWPAWPGRPPGREAVGLRWRPFHAFAPLATGLALLLTAALVPVPQPEPPEPAAPAEPASWARMDQWIDTMEESGILEPESLEDYREKLAELRRRPVEERFSHAGLEASDTLEESLSRDLRELAATLEELRRGLESLAPEKGGVAAASAEADLRDGARAGEGSDESGEARRRALQSYRESLESLAGRSPGLDPDLLEQLRSLDPGAAGDAKDAGLAGGSGSEGGEEAAAAAATLRERLRRGAAALGSLERLPGLDEDPSLAYLEGGLPFGPGAGAPGEEGGEAPLFYGDESDLGTRRLDGVENPDLERAAPGELLGLGEAEHEIDESPRGPRAGGPLRSPGRGGEAVWRDALVPEERAVLRRYFRTGEGSDPPEPE